MKLIAFLIFLSTPLQAKTYFALGDSVTAAFNCGEKRCRNGYSWATGDKIDSYRKHLGADRHLNVATTGAKSKDLLDQAAKATAKSTADHVTILIGGNDLCGAVPLADFKRNIESTIGMLLAVNGQTEIHLFGQPDMLHLYEIGKDTHCKTVWKLFRICPRLFDTDESGRRDFLSDWIDLNDTLAQVADQFGPNVTFNPATAEPAFGNEHLAWDCFHPSVLGHQFLSDLAWGNL